MTQESDMNERAQTEAAASPPQVRRPPERLAERYRWLLVCGVAAPFSLILGPGALVLLAFTVALALICLSGGMTELVRIIRSKGRLSGNGYVVPSILMPPVVLFAAYAMLTGLTLMLTRSIFGSPGLRRLNYALVEYREENNGAMPPAEQWCDVLQVSAFKGSNGSPVARFALNRAAVEAERDLPHDLVVLFGSRPGWNQVGGPELLPEGFRGNYVPVSLAGGEVLLVTGRNVRDMRWSLEEGPRVRPAPVRAYLAAGAIVALLAGAVVVTCRRYLRDLWQLGVLIVFSMISGGLGGWLAQSQMYLTATKGNMGLKAGTAIGLLAGVCFVLVIGYARDRMRPGASGFGFATVAGAITGAASALAVHVFLMIRHNDWLATYPLAGAGFGIWAGILLGWICTGIVRVAGPHEVGECAG